jgi:hypothetical protein
METFTFDENTIKDSTINIILGKDKKDEVYKPAGSEPKGKPSEPSDQDNDPTKPYTMAPRSNCQISASELKDHANLLIREQVLLISCYDYEVAINAAHQLVNGSQFQSYHKRQLGLKKSFKDQHSTVWDKLSNQSYDWAKPTLIFLEAYPISAQSLLEELLFSQMEISNLQTDFKKAKRFVVCIVEKDGLEQLLRKNPTALPQLTLWQLDYLKPLLSGELDAEELCQTIQAQSQQRLWGKTPQEIYVNIKGRYQHGTLREYIHRLETNSKAILNPNDVQQSGTHHKTVQNPDEIISRSQEVQAVELFKNSSPMEKIVLFVAVYFPNITYEDFASIVLFLLGDEIRTEKKVPNNKKGFKKKTHSEAQEETIEISLRDDWIKQEDETLEKLHLKIRAGDNGKDIIDFKFPYLRADLARYLNEEKPAFLRKQAQLIRHSTLIYRDDVDEVLENVTRLMVMMAKKNPNDYGQQWLIELVSKLPEFNPNDSIQNIIFCFTDEKVRNLACVAHIINAMLNDEHLVSVVNDFFEELFSHHHHYIDIFVLVSFLDYAPQFNKLSYLKRLILEIAEDDDEDDEQRQFINSMIMRGINEFLRESLEESGELYENLANLSQWLPSQKMPPEQYEQHQMMVFDAFFYLMMNATRRSALDEDCYGQGPSRYLLFRALETEQQSEQIKQLMTILAHPGAEIAIKKGWSAQVERFAVIEWMLVEEQDISVRKEYVELLLKKHIHEKIPENKRSNAAFLTALLMGKWRMILQGDLKATLSHEAENLLKDILTCFRQLDTPFQKQVRDYLNVLKNLLIEENKEIREELKNKNVPGKITILIGQQLTKRTNHLIRLRNDLIG